MRLRWPTFDEWGLIALIFIVSFVVLWAIYVGVVEYLARRDVRRQRADRSR